MTLGQRIYAHRKQLGISQEMLGERLGVSRQAVSKWETDAATPDMENLLALAREFHISVAELTGTPQPQADASPRQKRLSLFLLALLLAVLVSALIWALARNHMGETPDTPAPETEQQADDSVPEAPTPEQAPLSPASKTDFALLWYGADGEEEFLELGVQETFFPFGTTLELTEPAESLDTDFGSMTSHQSDCGIITVKYYHITDDPETESIWSLSTMVSGVRTPRGVHPGSTKAQVLAAYGDELVYCMKEEGGYSLVKHDYYYAFQTPETFGASLQFFMLDGIVAGIRVEHMAELGNEAFAPNHVSRFPLKDGEPDFSNRVEPEQEVLSDTRKVYIAWNQLATNDNLSAEEQYAYRRDVFGLLPYMDWGELGQMGHTDDREDPIFALMSWIADQDGYSSSEILWMQMGCTAKGIDGAYAEMYSHILSLIFFYEPILFAKALASEYPEEIKREVLLLTAYDAEWYPAELARATQILEDYLTGYSPSEEESGWIELLLLYLSTPIEDRHALPKSPSKLQ